MDLDEYIIKERKRLGDYSYEDFAKQCGVNVNTIFAILSGTSVPSSDTAYTIHKVTNGEVDGWELIVSRIERRERKAKGSKDVD